MSGLEILAGPGLALDEVKRLLDGAGLPSADVDEALLETFYAGRTNGALAGIVGLEVCGRDALLRSLVVTGAARGRGVGRALVDEAEQRAELLGIDTLYLLTTTAADYFRRMGYEDSVRDAAPEAIRASREFSALCPADAAFLCKRLRAA